MTWWAESVEVPRPVVDMLGGVCGGCDMTRTRYHGFGKALWLNGSKAAEKPYSWIVVSVPSQSHCIGRGKLVHMMSQEMAARLFVS